MLDMKRIRTETSAVKTALGTRDKNLESVIDTLLLIDEERRKISSMTDEKKAIQNKTSKEIPQKKKNGEDVAQLLQEMKILSDEIKENDAKISALEEKQKTILLGLPNTPDETVPVGADETGNVEQRKWGEPRVFEFEPLPHWELGANLRILDPERAAKVTGSRFHFLKGAAAKLERALMNFFLDTHSEHGYLELAVPELVNRAAMTGTGQLPKFEEDAFHLDDPDYFMISTAEVPVTNYHREEILGGEELPLKYCAFSSCFRKEAGSAGRDTRGLIRQHQFQKVEMVKFVKPETSMDELETLTNDAECLLQLLEIPYRVLLLCSGDLGFSSLKTYDIEVWMPSYNRYVEISSCSNFGDFQARRASIRYKNSREEKAEFLHTLNGSGLAIGRTVAAIMENYQTKEGSILIPEVLRPYLGGLEKIV